MRYQIMALNINRVLVVVILTLVVAAGCYALLERWVSAYGDECGSPRSKPVTEHSTPPFPIPTGAITTTAAASTWNADFCRWVHVLVGTGSERDLKVPPEGVSK